MIIYCIEDINDLKYVGKTKRTLNKRFSNHICGKYDKKKSGYCSSAKLHLEHSIIYILEECDDKISKEREKYWINKIDCINIIKFNGRAENYFKNYNEINKDKLKEKRKEHNDKFKLNNPEYNKIWSSKEWYCNVCDCYYNRSSKRLHLKSKKHTKKNKLSQDSLV